MRARFQGFKVARSSGYLGSDKWDPVGFGAAHLCCFYWPCLQTGMQVVGSSDPLLSGSTPSIMTLAVCRV